VLPVAVIAGRPSLEPAKVCKKPAGGTPTSRLIPSANA
jgi:hypothetical protein